MHVASLDVTNKMGSVGKAAAARKLAAAAVFGGGGLSLAGASLYGVLRLQAGLARRAIGNAEGEPPAATGWYGHGRTGPALKVALLGDSSAAGYGVETVEDTPGAHLASGLAEATERRVYLRSLGYVGAQTRSLDRQIDKALQVEPHVAVIMIGANDVTHARRPSESIRLLAAAQAIAAVEAGGRSVSMASILGPEYEATPALLFGPDRFHPSAAGYSSMAAVLLPSVLAAVGVVPPEERVPEPFRGETVLPISQAAVQASKVPGTEIDGTEVAGSTRGARGRWVQIRRRRRQPEADSEAPEAEQDTPDSPDADGALVPAPPAS